MSQSRWLNQQTLSHKYLYYKVGQVNMLELWLNTGIAEPHKIATVSCHDEDNDGDSDVCNDTPDFGSYGEIT